MGEDIALMALWWRWWRWHIFLALRDDFLQLRRERRGLGLGWMESVVGKLKISLLELVREPLELFVREAGGMLCSSRSDVVWNVTDIPLLKLRGVAEMRLVDVSSLIVDKLRVGEMGLVDVYSLIVDGVGARLQ